MVQVKIERILEMRLNRAVVWLKHFLFLFQELKLQFRNIMYKFVTSSWQIKNCSFVHFVKYPQLGKKISKQRIHYRNFPLPRKSLVRKVTF